jgi:25S rRNA (uracil2634-N3)-methyltransferase
MVERSMQFEPDLYPGYKHARTLGNIEGGGGWKGETRPARTYIFRGKEDSEIAKGLERDRRGADDNISDENDEDD